MNTYIIYFSDGREPQPIQGTSLSSAIQSAGIETSSLPLLDYYTIDGRRVQIANTSNCGCVYHAEEGLACPHDLHRHFHHPIENDSDDWEGDWEKGITSLEVL